MCIFCQIINGEIPSTKVYEDNDVLAILDISQTTYGHTLVIPKKHYDNILEMPSDELSNLIVKTQDIAKKIIKNLDAKGCNILANTNEVAGQTVMHAHIHIIPRYDEKDTVKFEFNENKVDLNEVIKSINK